jgi:RNA-directed DNA polymerase
VPKALVPSPAGEGPNGEESETTLRLGATMRQMTMQMVLPLEDRGEAPNVLWSGEADPATQGNERSGNGNDCLVERVVERNNLLAALKRVRKNKGSPGIDGMRVDELPDFLRENWERITAVRLRKQESFAT